ncbi:hypothetical protein J5N97_016558 [Dioscorea zingiberensis]|uniref:Hydroxyproline-rich glycoprotein family protein n=1 Tax=Dioscorea zingiberensis TaxID=325984 RepID=A0A9D5CJM6_9LILI|nr:hypothetical protein J5N97_016558 [Dioscorea zingiberensis]
MEEYIIEAQGYEKKRERQTISVPFLWEERPGNPKKEWVLKGPAPFYTVVPSQPKLVVSVPFQWEEEPGKPILQLPQSSPQISSLPANLSNNPFIEESYSEEEEKSSNQTDNWYSVSETDCDSSSNSSSATRNMSLDSSMLDFLFPLSSANAGFLNKVALPTESTEVLSKKQNGGNSGLLVKRSFTLGELIMMSRKLSCRMNPSDAKKPTSIPMDYIRKNLFVCFSSRAGGNKTSALISDA